MWREAGEPDLVNGVVEILALESPSQLPTKRLKLISSKKAF